ncbi:MAG: peptidylprolyl isomerase [Alphaproteobacteria bacterium]|jgi:peptidyl-prolyl cis-trans isomerase C|nr:peptidylprolyl isomerase [Alphaproteobacteria bacterium]
MTSPVRVRLLALSLAAGLLVAPIAVSAQTAGNPVVARVNGAEIRRDDVMRAIETLPAQYRQLPKEVLFDRMRDQLVTAKLIDQAAEKAKLGDDPEVKRQMAEVRERIIQQVYLTRAVEAELTDAVLKKKYDEMIKAQPAKEEVHARHILVRDEAEAKKVIAELEKGGNFAELAKKYSIDGSSGQGGDLGYFTREVMVPEFSTAAFALKNKGDYTHTPVKSQFGYHIILLEDKRTAPPPAFDEVKEQIKQDMAQELIVAKMAELRKGAKVEEFNQDGSPVKPAN